MPNKFNEETWTYRGCDVNGRTPQKLECKKTFRLTQAPKKKMILVFTESQSSSEQYNLMFFEITDFFLSLYVIVNLIFFLYLAYLYLTEKKS